MKTRKVVSYGLMVIGLVSIAGVAQALDMSFGEKLKLADDKAVEVGQVLADAKALDGTFVRVTGTIDSVCANRGCWLSLAEEGAADSLFVKFTCPIEGRLIPIAAKGHKAVVEGTLKVSEISEEHARHIAEEGGASAEKVAAISGPQQQIQLNSPAALVRDMKPEDAQAPATRPATQSSK